ncbi:Di-copper centre-containing protein [Aspergillus ellipticus CBS 707.79]|uniref:tyrosinase n=1 Tax=Aspergillus ellipticus CBS 707.79 TaxID=1448320 RepID=A0A319DU28_9EURO|nr:Di-copper centre-containing protein [Aspergillus ellipticus CBS 707.79]
MASTPETKPGPKPLPRIRSISKAVGPIRVEPGDSIPKRRDIVEWSQSSSIQDKIQKSLFVRAMNVMQERDALNDPFSFFQLGTIHWKPHVAGNEDPNYDEAVSGYCAHATYAFPTWHRVYVIVFEKAVYDAMAGIVSSIEFGSDTDERAWEDAAKTWRLPYWDWADPKIDPMNIIPQLVRDPQVSVLKPGSITEEETIDPNPLHMYGQLVKVAMSDERMGKYKLDLVHQEGDITRKDIFNNCIGTSRHGQPMDTDPWTNGVQDDTDVGQTFKENSYIPTAPDIFKDATVSTSLYRLFLAESMSYESFSSTLNYDEESEDEKDPNDYMSLEIIHNNIHFRTGGNKGPDGTPGNIRGHMSTPEVAGSDPIFFLHHCNVDRILGMWQVLNPEKWIQESYGIDVKGPNTLNDPLYPKDNFGTAWTSADVQDWHTLGYTYVECELTPDALKTYIENKYNASGNLQHAAGKVRGVGRNGFYDYVVNVDYDRYALDGHAYSIHLYLKDKAGKEWNLDDVFTFSAPIKQQGTTCGNCKSQKDAGVLSKAQVPITVQLFCLLTQPELGYSSGLPTKSRPSIEPAVVEKLLKDQLKWSVISLSGDAYDPSDIPGPKVTVHHAIARVPHGTEDSPAPLSLNMEKYQPLWSVTHGKAAGARDPTLL